MVQPRFLLQSQTFRLGTILAGLALPALVPGATAASDPHPELRRLSPADAVWVDLTAGRVIVGGRIALDDGPIEFFACPKETKEHESIVAVDAPARLVHAALLAIGLQSGQPASFADGYNPASGDPVAIEVTWQEGETTRRATAQEWVRDSRTGDQLDTHWVFAGSQFWKDPRDGTEYYQADGGDLVCVSNFPTAMLDLPIASSQANEALLFEAFAERVPPSGTPVELILSRAEASPGDAGDPAVPSPSPN